MVMKRKVPGSNLARKNFSSNGSHSMETLTIGFNTVGTGKPDPKTIYGIQHSWDRETRPKDHIWDSTQLGQENQTQRPYMGKDHIWDSTQWDRKIRPKRR